MATTVWKGQLGFGLVSIPVRLYRAARRERVRLHYLAPSEQSSEPPARESWLREDATPTARQKQQNEFLDEEREHPGIATPVSRVQQTLLGQANERPIPRSDLLRGQEVAPDQYVTFTQQELRTLRASTSTEMQIVRSVRLEEIDPVYFETSYYMIPDQAGERGYSLLFMALKESRYAALATVAMHGREHVVVIRPGMKGLLAHIMYYQDEIRAENEFAANISDVVPKELQLAKTFVEAIAGPFAPEEFKDSHREKLQELISAKVAHSAVTPARPAPQPAGPTVDIMEALRKSIENRRKPSQSETPVPRREPGKVTEMKSKPRKRQA